MNKTELIAEVSAKSELTKAKAGEVVNAFIDAVSKSLAKGEDFALVGFGTFKTQMREERDGRNPQTGKPLKIEAATVVKFTAGKNLKESVQEAEQKSKASKPRK